MPPPHVLMLGWEFPPLVSGGLGVACEGLVEALRKKTKLTLVVPNGPGDSSLPHLPVSPYQDHPDDLYGSNLPAAVESFTHLAASRADNVDFEVIHAHDWMTAQAGLEIRARTGKPLIFHAHSLSYDRAGPDDRGWVHDLERKVIQQADIVVAVSDYTREICLTHYGADPNQTVVVYNGVCPVQVFRSKRPFPEKLVVFLGRLVSQKNPRHFLEIARRVLLRNPEVRFAMAGAGHQLRSLMSEAVRFGISEKVHFTGFLNRRDVHHLLSMADVYCMPSASEPFGLAALEAAQFGVPIVISDHSGVSELLPHVKMARPDDLETFTRHILTILDEDQPPRPMTNRSWDEVAAELMELYQTILT